MASYSETIKSFSERGIHFPGALCDAAHIKSILKGEVEEEFNFKYLILTPPRSGTLRLVEITWLLLNQCDIDGARSSGVEKRHNFLESQHNKSKNQPLAKSHLPPSFLENIPNFSSAKKIIGFRNPKDILVSFYHFHKAHTSFGNFNLTWDEFFDVYKRDEMAWGCPIEFMAKWWQFRDRQEVLLVQFEDFNHEGTLNLVKKIAEFIGYEDEEGIARIAEEVEFSKMKSRSSINYSGGIKKDGYMRKGTVGDWKNLFSEEQSKYIDDKCSRLCSPLGLIFKFD